MIRRKYPAPRPVPFIMGFEATAYWQFVSGVFTPALAKHSKVVFHASLTCISVGVDSHAAEL